MRTSPIGNRNTRLHNHLEGEACLSRRVTFMAGQVLAATGLMGLALSAAAAPTPSVLFYNGVHSHYVANPLHDLGIEMGTRGGGSLADQLASGSYNVVVVGTLTTNELSALDAFLAEGGGVMVCSPENYPRFADYTATCEWLAAHGARPRWEVLRDSDASNTVRDVMGSMHSYSDRVAPPFNEGVPGVLTMLGRGTTGWEPPMSFDLGPDWQVIVRGAASTYTDIDKRNDVHLQPWIPAEGIPAEPPLMAVRSVGKGRLAVFAVRYYWIFTPPANCPTAEVMLTAGAGGKTSNWLGVCANLFRYLAEPSRQAGMGGQETPVDLLNPPPQVWEPPAEFDWTAWEAGNPLEKEERLQTTGLIGARTALSGGSGTVADYVREAKKAGLDFIVFMEDALAMDTNGWDALVAACAEHTDAGFLAAPGLLYEDAQGNHLYAFSDNVRYPKPSMLLPDKRLATVQPMRSRAYFDYDNEYIGQKAIRGYWNHNSNFLIPADYKLYNSFPVMSFIDGQPVDNALDDFLYLQGIGGCQCIVAFELMTRPELVADRAAHGWRVVVHRPVSELREKWHAGAWSFSGSGSQYITTGPRIVTWSSPNRLTDPHGQWWRPDLWEYRLRLKVSSEAGLKSVTLHDGDRQILRRWLPNGAREFAQELILSNCQQLGPTLVVEDVNGGRAVSMSFWNRNLVKEEFFCSDRCNFLGNSRLRSREGIQAWTQVGFQNNMGITPSKGLLNMGASPAVFLTRNSPTLPIDGKPAGFPTCELRFAASIPGEHRYIFAYPQTHIVSPEIGIGQADYTLAFDPAEEGATKTPLGHDYIQPQQGSGNAWGGWHHLVPTRMAQGYQRTYAWNWVPWEFRVGWHETRLTAKEDIRTPEGKPGLQIMYAGTGDWRFYTNGVAVEVKQDNMTLDFSRGTFGVLEHSGGSVVLAPLDGPLTLWINRNGDPHLYYRPADGQVVPAGTTLYYRVGFAGAPGAAPGMPNGTSERRLVQFARDFGIAQPGQVGYEAAISSGSQIDNFLYWRLNGNGRGVRARLDRADLGGLLPAVVENLNDDWSVQMVNAAMPWPNHRALPIREGKAYAEIDLAETDWDLFIGHPVLATAPGVKLLVSWKSPGAWYVEAHNPMDRAVRCKIGSNPDWPVFRFGVNVELPPGSSQTWEVRESATAQDSPE